MFTPNLSLQAEPDGEYTLHSVTLTPNGCFSMSIAALGAPNGHVTIPETQPVTLRINRSGEFCTLGINPIRHTLRNLRVGPAQGKTSIVAFTEVHDLDTGGVFVAGKSAINVPDPAQTAPSPFSSRDALIGEQWHAVANLMPPSPFSFFVDGRVSVPHPGHRASLIHREPQGINPRELILDLKIEELPGTWPQIVTQIDASYHEGAYQDDLYDSVLILSACGASWNVCVEKLH